MTARIIGIGAYAPEQVVTNQDLTKFLDTNDALRDCSFVMKEGTVYEAKSYLNVE